MRMDESGETFPTIGITLEAAVECVKAFVSNIRAYDNFRSSDITPSSNSRLWDSSDHPKTRYLRFIFTSGSGSILVVARYEVKITPVGKKWKYEFLDISPKLQGNHKEAS